MSLNDEERLRHIRELASEAVEILGGRGVEDLRSDRVRVLALIHLVELIGEAASRIGETTRQSLTAVPWRDIVATRNRLIHGYHDVAIEVIHAIVRNDLPPLIGAIEQHSR